MGDNKQQNQKVPMYDKVCKNDVNDVSWYVANEQILRDAGSFSYSNIAGLPFTIKKEGNSDVEVNTNYYNRVPGIAGLYLIPTIGISENAVSAVNTASRAIYSFVRHANSGSRNYEAPDLMIYLLAMANAYGYVGSLIRLYGTLRSYPKMNRFVPKGIIKAQGYDYDDMQLHISDLRALINNTLYKLQSLAVPTGMSYFSRYLWLNQNYMFDSESAKAQIYIPVFTKFYKFNATKRDNGGCLEPTTFTFSPESNYKYADIINHINEIMEPILSDEDMNIMSGDILKAYKTDIYNIQLIPEDYFVLPIHSLEVLSQINNATILDAEPIALHAGEIDIYQEDGSLRFAPRYVGRAMATVSGADYTAPCLSKLFTMYKDDVEPGDTMVASRLTIISDAQSNKHNEIDVVTYMPRTCGSEILLQVWIQNDPEGYFVRVQNGYDVGSADEQYRAGLALLLSRITKFDMFPSIQLFVNDVCYGPLQDVDNYTVLNEADIKKLHDAAMINMFSTKKLTNG